MFRLKEHNSRRGFWYQSVPFWSRDYFSDVLVCDQRKDEKVRKSPKSIDDLRFYVEYLYKTEKFSITGETVSPNGTTGIPFHRNRKFSLDATTRNYASRICVNRLNTSPKLVVIKTQRGSHVSLCVLRNWALFRFCISWIFCHETSKRLCNTYTCTSFHWVYQLSYRG